MTQIPVALGPDRPTYGASLTITGFVPSRDAGVPLTLQFRQHRGRWSSVTNGRSGQGGLYRFVVPALRSGAVRVIISGTDGDRRLGTGSATHALRLEPLLQVRGVRGSLLRTSRATVTGQLRGAGPKRLVTLQRRSNGRWYTIARSRTVGDGKFWLRWLPRIAGRGELRVRFPGDSDLAAADALVAWTGRHGLLGAVGRVVVGPNANRPGHPLTARIMRFIGMMSRVFGAPLAVTTGTNHSEWTTSGAVSDHFSGNAADFGLWANHYQGDRIAAAALVVAGLSPADALARARRGGLIDVVRNGLRVQVIWKTWLGGNHFNHVHVGVRPVG
jgi:hypothetical protein